MPMRYLLILVFMTFSSPSLFAAQCPMPAYAAQTGDQIVDWYAKYAAPAAITVTPRPDKNVIESSISARDAFHRRGISDPLYFEPLVQQIAAKYASDGDFTGLTTAVAEKIYRANSGSDLDFSAFCIDTRRDRFPDDTFTLTLYGVNTDNCQHVVTRGLVFSNTLVNGNANGDCTPDYVYFRMVFFPIAVGTNAVTLVCNKGPGGCLRR